MTGPMTIQEQKADGLRRMVSHMVNYVMAYRNAQGSLNDLRTRMENIKAEKASLDKRYQ